MAKLYSEKKSLKNLNELEPREETVNFLLSYSKALSVINCNKLKFEALLN
ncbi:hypothetical protein SAMN05428642_102235 [Flaviramulus basaltis]|uniref:Uncharacterized protein n=1 Tax=Flaviramulus basaltis TaxID=369401 RepID=A0A1K2IGZ2_9FLAO|nr:hypothetical protein SAMN05428642_102235 [Flaviramulus basaltis]